MSQQNASLNTSFDRKVCYVNSKALENILPSQISAGDTLFLFSHHKILPIIFKQKIAQLREWERRNPKTDTYEFDPHCQNLHLMVEVHYPFVQVLTEPFVLQLSQRCTLALW